MATTESVKRALENKKETKNFVEEVFTRGEKIGIESTIGQAGLSALEKIIKNNKSLDGVKKESVLSAVLLSKELELPLDLCLDYIRIKDENGRAKLYLTGRGEGQLAIKSGKYNVLNVTEIYEGELKRVNPLKEIVVINRKERKSNKVIGYGGYFRLKNGFTKTIFWSKEEMDREKKKFLKESYESLNSSDVTAKKVLLNFMLKNYGVMDEAMKLSYVNEGERA